MPNWILEPLTISLKSYQPISLLMELAVWKRGKLYDCPNPKPWWMPWLCERKAEQPSLEYFRPCRNARQILKEVSRLYAQPAWWTTRYNNAILSVVLWHVRSVWFSRFNIIEFLWVGLKNIQPVTRWLRNGMHIVAESHIFFSRTKLIQLEYRIFFSEIKRKIQYASLEEK